MYDYEDRIDVAKVFADFYIPQIRKALHEGDTCKACDFADEADEIARDEMGRTSWYKIHEDDFDNGVHYFFLDDDKLEVYCEAKKLIRKAWHAERG